MCLGLGGRGEQLNEWPLSMKEEDTAMVRAPRYSTQQPSVRCSPSIWSPGSPQQEKIHQDRDDEEPADTPGGWGLGQITL